MGLAQILCNGLQRDKERAGIKYHYAETKHRGILRSRGRKRRVSPFDILRATEVVRIPAAESPLLSSPLQRGNQEKTKQNKKGPTKSKYATRNTYRFPDSQKYFSIRHVRSTHVCERRIFAKVRLALHSSRFGELEYTE